MSLTKQIKDTFGRAALQREAALGLKGDDWARYGEIQKAHDEIRDREHAAYSSEYDTRVEAARKRLVDEAASKRRAFLPRFLGKDGFDKVEITRLAHRVVRQDHERTLEGLDLARQAEAGTLLMEVGRRSGLAEKLKSDFSTATDRRSGADRRRGPSR